MTEKNPVCVEAGGRNGINEKEENQMDFFSLFLLITISTVGYWLMLGITFTDALYMTIITISTVGYKEVVDMTPMAKVFSIFVIFGGIGIVGYTFTSLEIIILESNFKSIWRNKAMKKKIEQMEKHIIIAGASESSDVMIKRFQHSKKDFVIIEKDKEKFEAILEKEIPVLLGDATMEEVLMRAGIEKASGFISTLHTDADNIVAVLTARHMNKDLYIVSRAIEKNAREKLLKAGADNTVSSNEIGGNRMASLVLRPTIISFLDTITRAGDVELDLEDIMIGAASSMCNQSLKQVQIPQKIGLTVLATKKKDSTEIRFNPDPNEAFRPGDSIIVLGTPEQIIALRELADDDGERDFHTAEGRE
ncbi:MAG: potassium channel protein [Bacillota bacterium]|nr:potassium channel protein [Bacillota bacterium]